MHSVTIDAERDTVPLRYRKFFDHGVRNAVLGVYHFRTTRSVAHRNAERRGRWVAGIAIANGEPIECGCCWRRLREDG